VAPHYQLVVERIGAMDELTVQCERAGSNIDPATLCTDVERVLRDHLGIRVRAEVMEPGTLPRSEGKAVRVVDRR
jgi:phenylacetate-CoA ligase